MKTKNKILYISFSCFFIIFQILFACLGKMMYDNIPQYAESMVYYFTRITIAEYWFLGDLMLLEIFFDIKLLTNANDLESVKKIINSILLVVSIFLFGFIIVSFLNISLPLSIYIFFVVLAGIYLVLRIVYAFYWFFNKMKNKTNGR